MFIKIIFTILIMSLVGCVTQETKPSVSSSVSEEAATDSLSDIVDRMNQFQGSGAWQKYSVLDLTQESGANALFETSVNELKLTFTAMNGDKQFHFFIPGVVYMNQGLEKKFAHSTDMLEVMGLYGQLYLHVLEKAFPEGPDKIETQKTLAIRENNNITLNFLSGGVVKHAPWTAEVTVSRKSEYQVDFTIDLVSEPVKSPNKHSITRGIWSDEPKEKVLTDSTLLSDWTVNYLQIGAWEKGRRVSSKPVIGDTSAFKTVGDIRNAIKNR